jgi:hypothetical protein
MDNVQNCDSYINILSPQAYRSYQKCKSVHSNYRNYISDLSAFLKDSLQRACILSGPINRATIASVGRAFVGRNKLHV